MRRTPSPSPLVRSSSNQTKKESETNNGHGVVAIKHQHKKTLPALNFIIVAAKKVRVFFTRKRKPKPVPEGGNSDVRKPFYSTETRSSWSSDSYYSSSSSVGGQAMAINFTIGEIYKATENLSPANKIGEGGFGTVYKGKLRDGSVVAVKRAKKIKNDQSILLEFKNEILTLSKIEHLNLVRLLGYVEDKDERIMVMEYVGNGNLREHLDGKCGNALEIAELLDIAIDVAHALAYLHTYTDNPIIHRDIKASNILVTEKLRAKVSDFGFARLAADPSVTHISTQVKGTSGYLDPEYLRTYQLTEKSDVYSFGVLLVEMMTGRYPIEPNRPLKERVTIRWAIQKLKAGDAIFVMDPRLRRSPASTMAVEKVLKLAHHCLAPSRQSRPAMKNCAEVLWGIRKNVRERALSSSAAAASTSHHSANYPIRNAKEKRHTSFGIDEEYSLNSLTHSLYKVSKYLRYIFKLFAFESSTLLRLVGLGFDIY
ncbi:hypothetical protein LWI28_018995 [Acer negundo]|uniref:non-specific serine/threonine protein kinase n=1 Tax=Acer negundo TaxID=4023 RepID=A0AAD5JLP1_ACENE|nr:hypothetical protein LWI28_018995 [Acer negundo]